jgi:outer membrane protein insertion porin family
MHRALLALCATLLAALAAVGGVRAQELAGPQPAGGPVVESYEVVGSVRYDPDQVARALGIVVGQPVDPDAIDGGIRLLWRNYGIRVGRVLARDVEGAPGAVRMRIEVEEMPLDFEPTIECNRKVKLKKIREWARLGPEDEVHLHDAPQIRQRIETGYKRDGYHFVEVDFVVGGEGRAPGDIVFRIREGPRVKVRNMVFHGVDAMPQRGFWFWETGLKQLGGVKLGGPSKVLRRKPVFDSEELEADLLSLRQVYRDRGWMDAVVEVRQLAFNAERTRVTIHIDVDEGERYTVSELNIEAVELYKDLTGTNEVLQRPVEPKYPEEDLVAACALQPGVTFQEIDLLRDRRTLRGKYGEGGHIAHPTLPEVDRWQWFEPELVYDVENRTVAVTYRIAEGRPVFVRELGIEGNLHTRDRVIRREISQKPGQQADIGEIDGSLARVTNTGYFSHQSDPAHPPPRFEFRETADPSWKDLVFAVEEGQVINFSFSGGVGDSVGAFIQASVTLSNFDATALPSTPWATFREVASKEAFHGDGQLFSVQAAPGTERSIYDIRWRHGDIFNLHEDRISLDLALSRRFRQYSYYEEDRKQWSVFLGRQLAYGTWFEFGYTDEEINVGNLEISGEPSLGSPLSVPTLLKEQEGSSSLNHFTMLFRHTALDNNFDPGEGWRTTAVADFYDNALGASYDFWRASWSGEVYGRFGDMDLGEGIPPGWKMRWNLGASDPYGSTTDVPYTERFFLGGGRNMRGFRLRGVGPNENGYPIGGQTMLNGSVEYRQPLHTQTQPGTYQERESVRGALFVDYGLLDPDSFSLDFDESRVSAGFAVGLVQPFPFVFSFGWALKKGEGDDTRVFNFEIGF